MGAAPPIPVLVWTVANMATAELVAPASAFMGLLAPRVPLTSTTVHLAHASTVARVRTQSALTRVRVQWPMGGWERSGAIQATIASTCNVARACPVEALAAQMRVAIVAAARTNAMATAFAATAVWGYAMRVADADYDR